MTQSFRPKAHACQLPKNSLLWEYADAGDFLDCFVINADQSPRHAAEIITDFPYWVQTLLQVRKLITVPFGLSNDGPNVNDKVGPFPVEQETTEELIAGFNDKHLNFRVSVIAREGEVFLATWAHVHNIGGSLYLKAILPFHLLVAKNALYRVWLNSQKKNKSDAFNRF